MSMRALFSVDANRDAMACFCAKALELKTIEFIMSMMTTYFPIMYSRKHSRFSFVDMLVHRGMRFVLSETEYGSPLRSITVCT